MLAGCLLCPSVFSVSSQTIGRFRAGPPRKGSHRVQRRAHVAFRIQSASRGSDPPQFKQLLHCWCLFVHSAALELWTVAAEQVDSGGR